MVSEKNEVNQQSGQKKQEQQSKEGALSEELTKPFFKTKRHGALFTKASRLADQFSKRAAEVDETGSFPFENIQALKGSSYVSLTVPKEFGGEEISLYEFLLLQERLAQGDASTALCIGWHLGVIYDLREKRAWRKDQFELLCREVAENGSLINRAASEIATGSPTRGGLPQTRALLKGDKWLLTGRKTFTSMAPALDYSLVTATLEESDEVGVFLVNHQLDGVSIEENWDMLGMRGTRSDDLVLNQVELPLSTLVEREDPKLLQIPNAWLLHIPACYLGIAIAARNYAVIFASEYQPNSLKGPIKNIPEVQRKIGEIELELLKARHLLYSIADRWDNEPDKREHIGGELAAAKHIAVNSANQVVDLAMRIVGAKSLQRSNPLQRYYRDVRAGLHNPPMDDAVISLLAQKALQSYSE